MKPPIDTKSHSYVVYPSAAFSLERHEVFPYDRFAYTVLRIAVEALDKKELPTEIHISFSEGIDSGNWWTFNAGICGLGDSAGNGVLGFRISTTPVAPLLLYGMSHNAAKTLFQAHEETESAVTLSELRRFLIDLGSHFMRALREYKNKGLASCIRKFITLCQIHIFDIQEIVTYYDLLVQFIANHEIAHAYVGQLTEPEIPLEARDYRAFEYIVDTLATQWIYNHMIINIPDTDDYRRLIGAATHTESIYQNALHVIEGQILNFLVFAFAGALINQGRVRLEGGDFHPHALFRCLLQHVHFMTLLQSNFSGYLTPQQFTEIDNYYFFFTSLFAEAGLFTVDDVKAFKDDESLDDFAQAYELVKSYEIEELYKSRELFKIAESMRERIKSGQTVSLLQTT